MLVYNIYIGSTKYSPKFQIFRWFKFSSDKHNFGKQLLVFIEFLGSHTIMGCKAF